MFLAEKTVKNYVSALFASWAWNAAPRRPLRVRVFDDQHDEHEGPRN